MEVWKNVTWNSMWKKLDLSGMKFCSIFFYFYKRWSIKLLTIYIVTDDIILSSGLCFDRFDKKNVSKM